MQTSKVYIHRNAEGMWEIGVILTVQGEEVYVNKHEASTWQDAGNWVQEHYVG
jgi:hypothetical protein